MKGYGDGDGKCMQSQSLSSGSSFDASACSTTCQNQEFCWDTDGTIKLNDGKYDKCIVAGSSMSAAGPYQKRALTLELCAGIDAKYKKW